MKRAAPKPLRALLALLLAGCGADAPAPDPLARYPETRYLTAEGHGPSAIAAEDDARARLAARIRARLTARLTVHATEGADGAVERVEQRIVTEASFDRAELMRTPRALRRCGADGCVAVAVLDRAEAAGALRDAAADPAARFAAAVDAALARAADDWSGFTTALRAAEAAWSVRAPLGWQQAVIEGGLSPGFAADRARHRALQGERARRLAALRIAIAPPEGFAAPWPERVADGLADGLGRLGLTAAHGEGCADLRARPQGAVDCGRGPLGPRCELSLRIELGPCTGPALVTVEPAPLAAVDPRDPERAARRLAERVTGERLAPLLARDLSGVLPILRENDR